MAVTNTTTLAGLLPLITSEALFQANEKSLLKGLVRNFTIPAGGGAQIKVPVYANTTAAALTEGTEPTHTAISNSGVTITASEVGLVSLISDMAMRGAPQDVIRDAGKLMGEAIAAKIDADIAATFTNFSVTQGDGTTTITAAALFEAAAKLRALSVPADGMSIVLHPEIAYDVKSSITSTFAAPASEVGNSAMRNSYVGLLSGIPVYESAAIVSTSGDSIGAIFHRDAIGIAFQNDIQIETQREVGARGDKISGWATYGIGELIDAYGMELNYDSSIVS